MPMPGANRGNIPSMTTLRELPAGFDAQAMVLAAGRGERMRPLTDVTPKPLLPVRGQPLMVWPLQALARGGFERMLVNTAWLGEQIPARLGERPAWPGLPEVQIAYSHEGRDFGRALETAGGILRALPALDEVFWVVAGDVYMPDFVFSADALNRFAASGRMAHLWLVPNPAHNLKGDFGLAADGQVLNLPAGDARRLYTFSTVALYRRGFFTRPDAPAPAWPPSWAPVASPSFPPRVSSSATATVTSCTGTTATFIT